MLSTTWRRMCSGAGPESPLRRLLDEASAWGERGAREPALQWATEPYAAREPRPASPPPPAPHDSTVLLFPGQGAHFVGMGNRLWDIPAARDFYDFSSSVVGWDVGAVCRRGPVEELERRVQTCVVVTSLAALEAAREARPGAVERARAAAGFSLGEVAALVWGGALQPAAALRLVELRGAAMAAAAAERPGGMLALRLAPDARLPAALAAARAAAAERGLPDPVCEVANYLYPGCKVVAGDDEALRWLERSGSGFGVRRATRLRVAGAFHTALMARAGHAVRAGLDALSPGPAAPRAQVYCGAEARPYGSAAHVLRGLWRALAAPVRWEQTLHALYARPRATAQPLTLALGPGAALRHSLRHVNARAYDVCVDVPV